MWRRVQDAERRPKLMLAFLLKVVGDPDVLRRLMGSSSSDAGLFPGDGAEPKRPRLLLDGEVHVGKKMRVDGDGMLYGTDRQDVFVREPGADFAGFYTGGDGFMYFYRAHKLKQQEDARAKLVKRVIAQEEEEDLSWEVDDEVEEEEPAKEEVAIKQAPIKEEPKPEVEERGNDKLEEEGSAKAGALDKERKNADASQPEVFGSSMVVVDKEEKEDPSKLNVEESSDKKTAAEEPHSSTGDAAAKEGTKHETSDSSKDSDYSMVSRQRTATEEDLEWDEIEDLGEHEEKKGSAHGSSVAPKEELRKRLTVADDDEDLSWDIEDDDDKA